MDCLVEVTAPRAWLHAVVDSSGDESAPPLRFTLIDLDRVSRQAVGPPEPLAPQLLPRHVECLFRPFEIVHAYTLRARWREYVVRRPLTKPVRRWQWCRAGRQAAETRTPPPGRLAAALQRCQGAVEGQPGTRAVRGGALS